MSEQIILGPSRETIYQVVRAINSNASLEEINSTTSKVMDTLQTILNSSSSVQDFQQKISSLTTLLPSSSKNPTELDTSVSIFEKRRQEIIEKHKLNLSSPEADKEIEDALIKAVQVGYEYKAPAEKKHCGWKKCTGTETEKLRRCSGCRKVMYCSVDHQKQAWPIHKKVCKKNKSQ